MYADMGIDERTEMQLILEDLHNCSVVVTTPQVGRTCLNCTAVKHLVIAQKVWVLNEQQ
jgi:hypothetical protein